MDYYTEITNVLKERPMTLWEIAAKLSDPGATDKEIKRLAINLSPKVSRFRRGKYLNATLVEGADYRELRKAIYVYSLPEEVTG